MAQRSSPEGLRRLTNTGAAQIIKLRSEIMNIEEFNNLSDEQKAAFLETATANTRQIDDLTAERDSLRNENVQLNGQIENNSKELKATKELNFTLARKINVSESKDDETILYEFMKGYRTR